MPQFNEGNINSYLVPSGSLTGSLSNSGTLTGQIAIGSGGGTTDYNDLTNKPSINSVTLSGNKTTADLNISYNDLDDKPTIPAAQVNSDWNAESGVAEILNKPTLSAVATSGDYDDLTNKPVIPAAQVNSDWNAASGVAEILNKPAIPTELNDLSDVSIPSAPFMQYTWLGYNLNTNKWEDIVYQPYLDNLLNVNIDSTLADGQTIVYEDLSHRWINANYDYTKLNNKPSLATVATSGDYDDLTNTPVPAYENKGTISDLNNVAVDDGGSYKYIFNAGASNKPSTGGGTLLHMWNSGNHAWGCQVVFSDTGMYYRAVKNSVFQTWKTIVTA